MKFSIGIPAYKAAFFKECIESVLAQSFTDYELIIVDDASPQNLEPIVKAFSSERIRYYKNEVNIGAENVVDNWNKCLSHALGEFFVLLGDDDILAINYLAEFNLLIARYPECDVYHCRSLIIDETSTCIGITEPRPEFEHVADSVLERMKGNRVFFISDYVFRTNTLKRNGGFYKLPLAWASDDITSYIAAQHNGIAHTNTPLFKYRQNRQNISSSGGVPGKLNAICLEQKWIKNFSQTHSDNQTEAIVKTIIGKSLSRYIRKKKVYTIATSHSNFGELFKLFAERKQYDLGLIDLAYAWLMRAKERRLRLYK